VPTRSGWSLAATGAAAILAGRVFGFVELFLIGVVLLVLVAAAVGFAAFTPLRLEIGRSIRPARVHVGERSQVILAVRNDGRRRTPVLGLHDAVRGTPGASLLAAPLERGARASASYALPTTRRGVLDIGPLSVELTDAFGLARSKVTAVGRTTVTVYPRIVELSAPPRTGGADPHGLRSRGLHHEGDEFHSLRPYVLGDDLRRVHWPATARRDELVVRQLERHRHGRTTVVLETRPTMHLGPSFETAVVAAASILVAAHARGDELRLVSSGGHDSGIADDDAHLDALLTWLATAEARTGVVAPLPTGDRQGSPVRVTTDLDPAVTQRSDARGRGLTIAIMTSDAPARHGPGLISIKRPADLVGVWPILAGHRRLVGAP
jgi:uncharacterized protein (DUF58 family)